MAVTSAGGAPRRSPYLLLGGLLGLRQLRLFLAGFFRGALLGGRTLLRGCLRRHTLGWGGLLVVLLLEQRPLPLQGLLLGHLRVRLLLVGGVALPSVSL